MPDVDARDRAPTPPDRADRRPQLPDGVVYLAASAWVLARGLLALVGRAAIATVAFGRDHAAPAIAGAIGELGAQSAGAARRAARAAPAWLAGADTWVCVWLATGEVLCRWLGREAVAWVRPRARRAVVAAGSAMVGAGRRAGASARLRRSGRLALRLSVVVLLVAGGLFAASDPLLRLTARVVVGDIDEGDLPALAQTSTVVASDGRLLGEVEQEHRRVVEVDRLPDHVEAVVLAAEDRRFRQHDGYDLRGIARAALTNAQAGEVEQGGSTITQQVAKLNFTGDDASLGRKASELLHAVRLEEELSKDQLLERYLNQVYFGSGAYGIAAAAEEYFGVAPDELTVAQAALLAAIIRAPTSLDPRADPATAEALRDEVLERAAGAGLVPAQEARWAQAEPLEVAPPPPPAPDDPVVEAVRAELASIEALGPDRAARLERLETEGLRVETTLDPALQEAAGAAIAARFTEEQGPTAAVAAVDPRNGAVLALRSGRGSAGGFDLARQGRRQPGSAFKPFTAAAALEEGLAPSQRLVGSGPIEIDYGGAEPWRVDNFDGARYGSVDLPAAVRDSVNTAFAEIGVAAGVDAVVDVVDRAGIDVPAALGEPDQRGPSIALGGVAHGVSPLEMAAAYSLFANGGRRVEPYLIQRVLSADGEVLYEREPSTEEVVDPAVAGAVRWMLQDAVASGTGTAAQLDGVEVLGKTGTSQDAADAWFVGAVPGLSAAVWVGHPDGRQPMSNATGGTVAAPIWRDIVASLVDRAPQPPFPPVPPLPPAEGLELPDVERCRRSCDDR